MSDYFVFSRTLPLNSIVNPDVNPEDYLDTLAPFSFFDFLKYTKGSHSPSQFNDNYVFYITEWNNKKQNTKKQIDETIRDRYVELIKNITLNHTTLEEKRFLSNIDYNDELDVDIIIPFFSQKLQEVCNFYIDKREKLKYKIEKNKIKGISSSVEKSLFENITDVVFSDKLEIGLYQNKVNLDELISNLNIEIEELYDLYTNYLDNDPDQSYSTYEVNSTKRRELYTSNLNRIDANIFINIDIAIRNQIFENVRKFLTEFGKVFTINYDIDTVNLNCKPDDKLYNLITETKPYAEKLVSLRKSLIEKYIGCDLYYILTGDTIGTDITPTLLLKAKNPTGNLLNRHFPTTASVEEDSDLQSMRNIGLFFTPDKNGILYYSVPDKKYKIDTSKLKPGTLYMFPDPNLYGNTSGLSRVYHEKYPLLHICDYSKSVKNISHQYVIGDIKSDPYTQDYYSYFSKNQLNGNLSFGLDGIKTNLSELYNIGVLSKWNTDIYGNQYGLFKSKHRKNVTTNLDLTQRVIDVCENYDAGPITFLKNGFLPEQVFASSINWVKPNVWASDYYYNLLIEGGVGGFWNGMMERGLLWTATVVDGLYIDRSIIEDEGIKFDINLNNLPEDQLTIIDGNYNPSNYSWNLNYSITSISDPYAYIIDGLHYDRDSKNLIPKETKVLDGNTDVNTGFEASFENNYILSSIKYKEFDAGYITDGCDETFNFENLTNFIIKETLTGSDTVFFDLNQETDLNNSKFRNSFGSIYVRNITTGEVKPLSSALAVQFASKYIPGNEISNEFYSEVVDFNIYNDFLWIRSKSYIFLDRVYYNTDKFVYSGTGKNYLKHTEVGKIMNATNPFIFEDRTYSMIATLEVENENSRSFYILPKLYKVDYSTVQISEIPNNVNHDVFKNDASKNPINIAKINKPVLTYNSRNNRYAIVATIEDQNGFCYIYQIKFGYNGYELINQEVKLYKINSNSTFTINFYDDSNESRLTFKDISNNTIRNVNQSTGILSFS